MSDSMVTGSGASSGGNSAGASTRQNGSRPPVADIKDLGGQLVTAARNGANSLYEDQRNRAAEEIAALGEALERSAQSLDGSIGQAIAPYAETAARQVGDFADTLRDRSLAQLGSDIEGFARQWPMAFMAASIGLGFVAGRFLLSSGASISDVMSGNTGTQSGAKAAAPSAQDAPSHAQGEGANGSNARTGQDARSGSDKFGAERH